MSSLFPFRSVNESVGTMVVLAGLLVLSLIVFAGSQHWFEPQVRITVNLPPEGSFGLKTGARIELLGVSIGSVHVIDIDDDGAMQAIGTVRQDFARFIGPRSGVEIKRSLVLAGDPYLEISKDTPTEGARWPIVLRAFVRVDPSQKISELVTAIEKSWNELKDPANPLQRIVANLLSTTESIDRGEGLVGKLLRDESWSTQVTGILKQIDGAVARLDESLQSFQRGVDKTAGALAENSGKIGESFRRESAAIASSFDRNSAKLGEQAAAIGKAVEDLRGQLTAILGKLDRSVAALPEVMSRVEGEAQELPGLIDEARDAIVETRKLVEALQRHWVVRSYVAEQPRTRRITPQAVGASAAGGSGR